MENLRHEGHKTLIFSQHNKMLDIIEKVLLDKVSISVRLRSDNINPLLRDTERMCFAVGIKTRFYAYDKK